MKKVVVVLLFVGTVSYAMQTKNEFNKYNLLCKKYLEVRAELKKEFENNTLDFDALCKKAYDRRYGDKGPSSHQTPENLKSIPYAAQTEPSISSCDCYLCWLLMFCQ